MSITVVSGLPMHVLIVGGGPVGLTTSIALSSVGVSNTVIETSADVYGLPRAIVMDALRVELCLSGDGASATGRVR
ncbi:MAG: FAD-dependent monooxygenase [Ilumatobacteraceae bacterium]